MGDASEDALDYAMEEYLVRLDFEVYPDWGHPPNNYQTTKEKKMGKVITVDFSNVESGGGRIHVPEGDYALEVTKVTKKIGSESGEAYLVFAFELSKGPKKGNGKVLNDNFSLQPQSLWKLKNFLEAAGKTVPAKALKIPLDKLVGLECAGTLIDDEYQGRKQSTISAFFPLDDLGKTSDGGDFGDDEEETPKKKKKTSDDEDEEEEVTPKKKKKPAADDEEEEEETTPKKKKKKTEDDEDEDSGGEEEELFS